MIRCRWILILRGIKVCLLFILFKHKRHKEIICIVIRTIEHNSPYDREIKKAYIFRQFCWLWIMLSHKAIETSLVFLIDLIVPYYISSRNKNSLPYRKRSSIDRYIVPNCWSQNSKDLNIVFNFHFQSTVSHKSNNNISESVLHRQ